MGVMAGRMAYVPAPNLIRQPKPKNALQVHATGKRLCTKREERVLCKNPQEGGSK